MASRPPSQPSPVRNTPPVRRGQATPYYPGPTSQPAQAQTESTKKPRLRKPRKDDPGFVPPVTQKNYPSAVPVETGERLSKRVMQIKGCSRKEAEQYIEGGFVTVNGVVVEEPAHRVDQQTVALDPQASLLLLSSVTLILNKPPGTTDGLEELDEDEPPRAAPPRAGPGAARGRKGPPPNARSLLTPQNHWEHDPAEIRTLKRHFNDLEADVELETGASGLVVFTQDWRTTRKLSEDLGVMEHEYLVEVKGEVEPDALKPIGYALKDERNNLPQVKVSVSSSSPEMSRIRFAIKGSHPGLVAYLCGEANFEILAMRRVRMGRVTIADLPVGQWRYLADWEKF
ncbi:MAG: RNA-binding protein [Burkholderiales bacterium PBB2]|nr:MAG: RNA-binding protein [Burkholderiales bacterium PBB2]